MTQVQTSSTFQFVDWAQVTGPTKDPATRVLIRKQAMSKAAAARKQRGNWGKVNLGQGVVIDSTQVGENLQRKPAHQVKPQNSRPDSGLDHIQRERTSPQNPKPSKTSQGDLGVTPFIPRNMSCTDYELMRMTYDFDLLDLSAMTTFHVGRITTQTLLKDPASLAKVLKCKQWSYFSYLPSRYGHFPCLDDAARCVASRVRHWIGGDIHPSAEDLALYSKALASLQVALNDPATCMESEILCATQVLSIHELLDTRRDTAWSQHAAGAKSLVEMRGPGRFESKFDRALFLAQVGPINTEALIENRKCFLEEEAWFKTFQSIVMDQPKGESIFADCGSVVVSLWAYLSMVPGIYKDVQDVVCSRVLPSESNILLLKRRIEFLDEQVSLWYSTYEPMLLAPSLDTTNPDAIKSDKRYETLAVCLAILIILKRLCVALDPLGSVKAEALVQQYAARIAELRVWAVDANPRAALFMAFKMEVARATLATKDDWTVQSLLDKRVSAKGLIAPWVFKRWCEVKGRAT